MGHLERDVMRTSRSLTVVFAVATAGVVAAWVYRHYQSQRPWPGHQRWPSGSRVRWVDELYVEEGPDGDRVEVHTGDEGTVVVDDSPVEFCVTFPATGPFCPPRSSVVLIERATETSGNA